MKKLLILSLIIFTLAFTGCGIIPDVNIPDIEIDFTPDEGNDENSYSEGLIFESNNDGTCAVVGMGECLDEIVVVPPTSPDGDKVTTIGSFAFSNVFTIVEVVLPEGIEAIESGAFHQTLKLSKIKLPDSLRSIGYYAFQGSSISEISFTGDELHLDNRAFIGATRLTDVNLSGNITIGKGAFYRCENLKNVYIEK